MRSSIGFSGALLTLFALQAPAQESDREILIVTASRTEQTIAAAPAAMTVVTDVGIDRTPSDDFGDIIRSHVPGFNVSQTSARDINITGRGATNTLSNSLLTLLDGRSTYLDFFGINMWDLMPVQTDEIEQIEVIRGPGSALYGANAMSGVINVITKRPKDMTGTTVVVGTPYANIVHAQGDDDFAFKVSAGYYDQPAYDRPTGQVPGSNPPQVYPDFENEGTTQKRVNARLDWGLGEDSYVSLSAGLARTDGIVHTGIGPFDIDPSTELSYVSADWNKDTFHLGFSAQMLDGDATNLLTLSSNGQPLGFKFVNDTYNLEASNTNAVGEHHLITYGGNVRTHNFDLAIAPLADSKDELGVFVQDDIGLTDKLRWVIGVRYDDIDPLADTVLTPRTSLIYSIDPEHSIRVSYNEAFRTPSTINSYLAVSILQALAPGIGVAADAYGDPRLTEESLKAYEIGYVGTLGNDIELTVAAYRNETRGSIDFFIADYYGPTNLPTPLPNWPAGLQLCFAVPPGTTGACPNGGLAGIVPSDYSYRNIGRTIDRGIEFSLNQELQNWYWFANLSWQDDPEIEGANVIDVNRAPEWRANFGVGQDSGRFFWNANVNYQDSAYWADVLFARAETDAFTQLNASLGWRFHDEKLALKLIGQNLTDQTFQQHIFGDYIERRVLGQVSISF